jgi:hypothetical protein
MPQRSFPHVCAVALPLLLASAGCSSGAGVTAPSLLVEGDEPAIVMAESVLVLEGDEWGWRGEIGYTFRNRTERTISLLNCNGGYGLQLERWDGAEWVVAWSPALLMCLSAPIELAPGETLSRTLGVFGGRPDSNMHPRFAVSEIEGTYRLVITAALWDYDHDGPPWGTPVPVEHRSSGPFEVRVDG